MQLKDLEERALIDRIRGHGLARPEGVIRGIGDDAAVFRLGGGRVAVVTTDLLSEGIHFRFARCDPRRLGARALLVNLSDVAAMGARPREAFLALAAPAALEVDAVEALIAGFLEVARSHDVNLLGGDTCASASGLFLAVTLVADADEASLVWRSGGRPGDVLLVSGTLGDSGLGLHLLESGLAVAGSDRIDLVRAHELPQAFVAEGQWLAATGAVTAMIDVSDGLVADLGNLLRESGGLGATLDAAALPLSPALERVSRELDLDPVALALSGGEDYRLLLAVPVPAHEEVERAYRQRFDGRLIRIGKIEAEPGIRVTREGREVAIPAPGYEHWRR